MSLPPSYPHAQFCRIGDIRMLPVRDWKSEDLAGAGGAELNRRHTDFQPDAGKTLSAVNA